MPPRKSGQSFGSQASFRNLPSNLPSNLRAILNRRRSNPTVADLKRLDRWESDFIDLYHDLPESLFEAADSLDATFDFKIGGVFEDGLITGSFLTNGQRHQLFINLPGSGKSPMGCTCSDSGGIAPCIHLWCFLDEVTDELADMDTALAQRVVDQQFDRNRPDMSQYRPDPKQQILQLIQHLLPDELPATEDVGLAPAKDEPQQRIAWAIDTLHGTVEVIPYVQQIKKRGGWTKGRKVPLENLRDFEDNLTPMDERIRSLVRIESEYYRASFELDPIDAICEMVGAHNVLLNGAPATVELFDGALRLFRNDVSVWLQIDAGMHSVSRVIVANEHFVHFRSDLALVQLCKLSPQQLKCLQGALKLPKIPIEHEQVLLDAVARMQEVLTIHLPEELAGKVVEEAYRPVLMLRSRSDGSLDYGVRLRCSSGLLVKPGIGRMLMPATRDGSSVQVKRSAMREATLCRMVAQRFALPRENPEGSIQDFEAALNLIDRLENHPAGEAADNVEVLWDKTSEKPLKMLGALSSQNVSVGITSKRDWFQLSGTCNFAKESIDLSDLLSGLQAAGVDSIRGDYVRLGDKGWAKVSKELRDQFAHLHDSVSHERGSLKFDATSAPAIRDLMNSQFELQATRAWSDCLSRLERSEKLEPELPKSLNAELRDYQVEGFKWLRRLAEWGVGGILADDMGLGKTLQTLAVILDRSQQGPTLVIAPTSVGFNWVRESEKFAPELKAHLYRETDRAEFLQQIGPGSLVVCSYGLALRDAKQLAGVHWTTLVLDEAQAIKNSRSKTSTAIATLPADWKIALTGTPVENHLGELWSLFRVVAPGILGGWDQFRRRFAAPIEKDNDQDRRDALRERLKPFLLRRTKEEVLKDLPPRTEMNLYVELSPAERAMYDQVRLSAVGEVDQIAKLADVQDQRFRILALLTRLRQLACSPKLVHEDWAERSSKLELLCETLRELRDEGHRVLIFSQFVKHLTLIREMLEQEQITFEYLDGSTSPKARQERVDSFQNGDATAFLISLKAGGTGLNLTAADYVIHMDPWWNPAVEDQATDRAHRMGQDKPVMVYRLVAQGTIEEEILRLHDTKRDLVSGIMDGSAAAGKLSTDDLLALLRS